MALKYYLRMILMIVGIMIINTQALAQELLDKAQFKFYYEYLWQFDTLKNNDLREDRILLQVGQSISKSYPYSKFYYDSVIATPDSERVMTRIRRELARSWVETGKIPKGFIRGAMGTRVYKNYPEGQVTVTDQINENHYIYVEEINAQTWQMIDSTKPILEYTCQMAVSDFRGRRWIAWFAHDIPISDGPWKFSGLPGLIMEVHDIQKHYHFTLVGIEQVENEPVVFSPVVLGYRSYGRYEETTRLDFLRALVRYLWNSSAIMNAELGRETFDETSNSSRPHDLIERDYR